MAGKVKAMCDKIIAKRGNGNPTMEKLTKTKLLLKGVNPDKFNANSPDDPQVIDKLIQIANDLGVVL